MRSKSLLRICCVLVALTILLPRLAAAESPAERDARMQWWRDARFGLFIHWGLYAIPAGKWQGQPVGGIGEWIMNSANIPVEQYEQLAQQFNPVQYNADQWVRAAKDAGMRYIVITSKHHDGFSLFDSAVSSYDVVDATPYGKCLLKPLADACRREGLKFCVYHSIMDWHHPAQYRASADQYNPTKIHPERKQEYVDYMKAQLRELLTCCDPAVLWFDGEWVDWWTEEDARELATFLRELKPNIIINNRIGKGRQGMEGMNKDDQQYSGDFGTPEQQIPATGLAGVDWETCMTMNDTWGFVADDHNWKSAESLIRNIIDTASKGGNYLLNVGPTAQGEIPQPSLERLAQIGAWMRKNGESIYATQANPLADTPWGRCTRRTLADGSTRLYLHVFDWPSNGQLAVGDVPGVPHRAMLLDGRQPLKLSVDGQQVNITLPPTAPDKIASVVVLELKPTQ
ncbi:MAG: alpha-L-fucosidase [Pirellulaceae bacterium]|nr:alpha-L-fucosidase [Pirellulaceae bacterium]